MSTSTLGITLITCAKWRLKTQYRSNVKVWKRGSYRTSCIHMFWKTLNTSSGLKISGMMAVAGLMSTYWLLTDLHRAVQNEQDPLKLLFFILNE